MARNVLQKHWNGTGWDEIHPITKAANVIMADGASVESAVTAHKADYTLQIPYVDTAGSANVYTAALSPALTSYVAGVGLAVKINVSNTGASTINVNGLGAKSILDSKGNAMTGGKLKLNSVYTLRYNGTAFILQGEGGEYGTAIASDLLAGKTMGTDAGLVSGTIPIQTQGDPIGTGYRSPVSLAPQDGILLVRIPNGAYIDNSSSGFPEIFIEDPDFIASNFRADKNMLGLQGSMPVYYGPDAERDAWSWGGQDGVLQVIPNTGYYDNGGRVKTNLPVNPGNGVTEASSVYQDGGGGVWFRIPVGAYINAAGNGMGLPEVHTYDPDFIASNFRADKNMLGLQGSMPVLGSEEFPGWRRGEVYHPADPGRVHLRIPIGAYLTGTPQQQGQVGVFADDAEFIPGNFLNTANVFGLQGSIPIQANGARPDAPALTLSADGTIYLKVPAYQYYQDNVFVKFYDIDAVAGNFRKDTNIFGVIGTLQPGVPKANGVTTLNASGGGSIRGLSFTPDVVVVDVPGGPPYAFLFYVNASGAYGYAGSSPNQNSGVQNNQDVLGQGLTLVAGGFDIAMGSAYYPNRGSVRWAAYGR